ncbi:lytic polysaccharide monooxygenase [Micromonospora sp. NPDC050686]|uniref:lytic polysaccharide monooxygenase n=1 Tax=Micromonospora sp. NPDC050686 TaxID=3154631 RepID=UPI0033C86491
MATDPPVRDGAYQMPGRLPANRTGRHLIYTIWQNSNTQDTYYSCSDVVFRVPGGSTAAAGASPRGGAGTTPASGRPGAGTEVPVAAAVTDERRERLPWAAVAGVSVVLVAVLVGARLRRPGTAPPGRPCEVRSHRAGRRRVW